MTGGAGRVLITGASGFVGSWLVAEMLRAGAEVAGLGFAGGDGLPLRIGEFAADGPAPGGEVRYRSGCGSWTCAAGDICDPATAVDLIARHRPGVVFHLAAQSSAARSFSDPAATLATNTVGALSLLDAVRTLPAEEQPLLLVAGSADEYGPPDGGAPLHERSPLRPASPYGVSKAAQTLLCLQHHRSFGVPVIVTRAFSHTGPGQSPDFLFPSVARQIAAAERGDAEPVLKVGELSHRRDYSHVGDVVRAYRMLAESGRPGRVYNVCSGRALRLADGVEMLAAASRMPLRIETDPARLRPSDIPLLVGDATRLRRETGWEPEASIETALSELLEWCRKE